MPPRFNFRSLLVVSLFLVVVGEVFFRIFYSEPLMRYSHPLIYMNDETTGARYIPDAVSVLDRPSIKKRIVINHNGYYGTEFQKVKAPGVFRIAVIGTSEAAGIWLNEGRPFPAILQKKLQRAGMNIEICNFSVDGNLRGMSKLLQLEGEVLEYSPDLVLLEPRLPLMREVVYVHMYRGYVTNPGHSGLTKLEYEREVASVNEMIDKIESAPWSHLYNLSYIIRAATRLYLRVHPSEARGDLPSRLRAYQTRRVRSVHEYTYYDLEGAADRTAAAVKIARSRGAEVLLYHFVSDAEKSELFRRRGLSIIELGVPETSDLRHESDRHYNAAGQEWIAEAMYRKLIELPQIRQWAGLSAEVYP